MLAYDSNAVSRHSCGASRGCARSIAPSRVDRIGIGHTGEARTLRAG